MFFSQSQLAFILAKQPSFYLILQHEKEHFSLAYARLVIQLGQSLVSSLKIILGSLIYIYISYMVLGSSLIGVMTFTFLSFWHHNKLLLASVLQALFLFPIYSLPCLKFLILWTTSYVCLWYLLWKSFWAVWYIDHTW